MTCKGITCEDCLKNNRIKAKAYRVIQEIYARYKIEDIFSIIEGLCPELSKCPKCGISDFDHVDGCKFASNTKTLIKIVSVVDDSGERVPTKMLKEIVPKDKHIKKTKKVQKKRVGTKANDVQKQIDEHQAKLRNEESEPEDF